MVERSTLTMLLAAHAQNAEKAGIAWQFNRDRLYQQLGVIAADFSYALRHAVPTTRRLTVCNLPDRHDEPGHRILLIERRSGRFNLVWQVVRSTTVYIDGRLTVKRGSAPYRRMLDYFGHVERSSRPTGDVAVVEETSSDEAGAARDLHGLRHRARRRARRGRKSPVLTDTELEFEGEPDSYEGEREPPREPVRDRPHLIESVSDPSEDDDEMTSRLWGRVSLPSEMVASYCDEIGLFPSTFPSLSM